MSRAQAEQILESLQAVAAQRAQRAQDPALAAQVASVKRFQQARFAHTYADLMVNPRYAAAAQFFLTDLYGPADFAERDTQFARVVPALVRLFPKEIVGTVASLAKLHALSEDLDSAMGLALGAAMPIAPLLPTAYADLWRHLGRAPDREQQIALMLDVGEALDRYTRNLLLRQSLRLMRAPAQAAGLSALQGFLEKGFDTFRAMHGASDFLQTVGARERDLARRLFAGGDVDLA